MDISQSNTLTKEQILEIISLESLCSAKEKLENRLFLSNEINYDKNIPVFFFAYEKNELVGFLTMFIPTHEEAEISAIVHPQHTQRGIFTSLDCAARKVIDENGIARILYCVESKCTSAAEVLKHWKINQIQRSEYRMSLAKQPLSAVENAPSENFSFYTKRINAENAEAYMEISSQAYGDEDRDYINTLLTSQTRLGFVFYKDDMPLGTFVIGLETANKPFIYGVAVSDSERGKGYGKLMVKKACEIGLNYGNIIQLDVDSENPVAFHLYKRLGFEVTFQVDYYQR